MKTAQDSLQKNAQKAAAFLKLLAHPERLITLCQLVSGEKSVSELLASTKLSPSAFSQHLAKLREEGLVVARKEAQQAYYSLCGKEVEAILNVMHEYFCEEK
ncbi:MAG: transcriptional regulator [Gammaproteobacteria bacterium CG11_big_fil_rev_8_21_14_0_20_46_22]|nr:MAG: transcriptional regulator [Gammaproteobacteria bacterium CG12_big_fil_rev_8_21_14_0_65_46_12]PIR10607.1 MAG: transcriptional regulator [Gammaproteobacteria bacterium CG11_big_fil_rev_8_21_14_0_20_46_22]